MILTTHALVGAALGKNIANPWLIAIITIPFHFFLDHFQHGEYLDQKSLIKSTWWKIFLDLSAALAIPFFIASLRNFSVATMESMTVGMFFSMFPDSITLLYWKFRRPFLEKIYRFHAWCHRYPQSSKEREWNLRNSVNDVLLSLFATIILFL